MRSLASSFGHMIEFFERIDAGRELCFLAHHFHIRVLKRRAVRAGHGKAGLIEKEYVGTYHNFERHYQHLE